MCAYVTETDRVCVYLDREVDEGLKVNVEVWSSARMMLLAFTQRWTHTHIHTAIWDVTILQ